MTKTIYEYTDEVCRVALLDNGWLVVNGTDAKLPYEERRKLAAALATQGAGPGPVPMVLHCPECRARHVDEGEPIAAPSAHQAETHDTNGDDHADIRRIRRITADLRRDAELISDDTLATCVLVRADRIGEVVDALVAALAAYDNDDGNPAEAGRVLAETLAGLLTSDESGEVE